MFGVRTLALALGVGALGLVETRELVCRRAESIRFAVEEGASSTKTFTFRGEFETALVDIGVSGMEVEVPEVEMSAKWSRKIVVEDEYRALRAGAPKELVRSFEDLAHEFECSIDISGSELSHQEEGELDAASALEGTRVLFTWNDDTEVYDKRYVDEEDGDVELLEELEEDMDLRALLPEGEVDAGDDWQIAPSAFLTVLQPGGDLGLELGRGETERSSEMSAAGLDPRMAGALEAFLGTPSDDSEVSAKLVEVREVDGRRIAIVALTAELETSSNRTELYEAWMRQYDPDEEGVVVELQEALVTCECKLAGELAWDVEAGRARSLELAGDAIVTLKRSVSVDLDGQQVEVEMELEMEGELSMSATFE